MTVHVSMQRWALLGLLLVLTSCGSGGTGGSGSPVVASGTVTGFGSIVVTDITFNIEDATITVNGQPGSATDLRLGHVVTVRGTRAPRGAMGTAETVVFESNVRGPIASIDTDDNSLVVLGQLVLVDDATQFGETPLNALVVGNVVEVSGFPDAEGVLRATRVDKTQEVFVPGIEIEVEGPITDLNRANQTFTLNMLQVDFSMAELLNLPGNRLRNGQVVEVKSRRDIMNMNGVLVLVADSIAGKDIDIQGDPGDAVELQGIVTRGLAADQKTFEVNGQAVRLTDDTVFEVGMAANIAVDVRIEVEGVFDADGIIVAEEVELGTGVELQGAITSGLAADNTFEVNDQRVRFTADTVFAGGTADNIAVGVPVEVEGAFDAEGVLVAAVIDFFVDIEGIITQVISADTFEVNGQRVRFTADTVFEEGTINDIAVDVPVEVEGRFDAEGVLVATEIEFLQ
jgi:Domain of unknown function (DUF5666)